MKVFTIDSDNNITVHATRKAARETGAVSFTTAGNLAEIIGPDNKRLVEIWNSLTGVTPVKKFTSREVAARRIFNEVRKLTVPPVDVFIQPARAKAGEKRFAAPKAGSRKEVLLGLISRTSGASLEELVAALDWQKHSVRGFIATLGKTIRIESYRNERGARTYRTSEEV